MKRQVGHIGIIVLLLILGGTLTDAGICSASIEGPSPHEAALLSRINQARLNPLETARELGLNPDQVWEDFPELHNVFTNGLPPLSFNDKLYHAAKAHTEDMLERRYFASVSPEGETPEERILESGYLSLATGEALALFGFNNFIPPESAVDILFRNMFLDELSPERIEPRNILNPEFKETGISIGAGVVEVQGNPTNAYIAVCDFGTGADEIVEKAVLRMINEARRDPLEAADSFFISETTEGSSSLEEGPWIADRWFPPLASNGILRGTARDQAQDMIDRLYYDTVNPEGKTFGDRALVAGYNAEMVSESLGIVISGAYFRNPFELARTLYENIIRDELNSDKSLKANLFDSSMTEAGVGFASAVFQSDEQPVYVYLAVVDMARPVNPAAYLVGNVYQDGDLEARSTSSESRKNQLFPWFFGGVGFFPQDADRNFDMGEGIPGLGVEIVAVGNAEENREAIATQTDVLGGYQVELPDGYYQVFIKNDGNILETFFVIGNGINYMKDMDIP